MKSQSQSIHNVFLLLTCSNLVASRPDMYEKLEVRSFQALSSHRRKLFVRHSVSKSEMAGLLYRVIVVRVEERVLYLLSLSTRL